MVTSKTVDLSNCDREQIQYAGAIQPHGAMLTLQEPELRILQASMNTGDLLGFPAERLIGSNLHILFSEEQVAGMRGRFLRDKLDGAPMHIARAEFARRHFDVLAHRYDQVLFLEFEQRSNEPDLSAIDIYSDLHGAITRLSATTSLQAFLDLTANQIQVFTGFDRVMIYKFMEDSSGWVRSEALSPGMDPYLGLHYPASDIPTPARRLFSLTWVRHQPDIAYIPVPVYPENNPVTGAPLDMSYAFLRSVSVMYVDYLKNMGTQASMVMTLLKDGKLWGLIACHHHTGPKHVPNEVRVACEFMTHMVSSLMSAKEDIENYEYRIKLKSTQALLVENISRRADFVSGFTKDIPNLLDFIAAEGAATIVNGKITSIGVTPREEEIAVIVKWLSTAINQDVFATDCLSLYLSETEVFKDRCAGLLSLRFSPSKSDFVLWFRPELISTVDWAGDPKHPVNISDDGQRLSPRTSFKLWKETVFLKSSPWTAVELDAARELRGALLELVLRRAEELGRLYADLERSHAELDSFAYIASHDLKEPLRGIHNYAEILREDYADKLDEEGNAKLATLSRLSQRMDELLSSLLEYSRLGRTELSYVTVDLNVVLSEALDLLQARIRKDNVTIRVLTQLPVVRGDHTRMVEVFMNLISNAIKYNDKSEKNVEIGVEKPATGGGNPVIYVRDNGIGIQEKHFKQIFQIFRRLHGRDEFGGGSGAGLTITDKIIDRLGGRIWLKSAPGDGTTFYFTVGQDTA